MFAYSPSVPPRIPVPSAVVSPAALARRMGGGGMNETLSCDVAIAGFTLPSLRPVQSANRGRAVKDGGWAIANAIGNSSSTGFSPSVSMGALRLAAAHSRRGSCAAAGAARRQVAKQAASSGSNLLVVKRLYSITVFEGE